MGTSGTERITELKTDRKAATPPLYRVLMHNDDYTTMEFVVSVLESIFHFQPTEANRIMLQIHMSGVGVCGTFPFDIAETKVQQVHLRARQEEHPLKCSMEEV